MFKGTFVDVGIDRFSLPVKVADVPVKGTNELTLAAPPLDIIDKAFINVDAPTVELT
jgi:hypothetical protein